MIRQTKSRNKVTSYTKPRLRVFAVCEYVVIDKANRFSLINIFEKVFLKTLPTTFQFNTYVAITAEPGEHNFKLEVESPKNKIVEIVSTPINMENDEVFAIQGLGTFEFKSYGRYWFSIYLDDQLIGKEFITVSRAS